MFSELNLSPETNTVNLGAAVDSAFPPKEAVHPAADSVLLVSLEDSFICHLKDAIS